VLWVPFIGWHGEWRGWEVGGQVAASGVPLGRRLLVEEAMRWPFDEGEMKRKRRHIISATRS
jgi:hypothetical protein